MRASRQRKQHADRAVSHVLSPIIGHIDDWDSLPTRRRAIDIVHAHPTADDQLAVLQSADGARAETEEMINHEACRILDQAVELVFMLGVNCPHAGQISQYAPLNR